MILDKEKNFVSAVIYIHNDKNYINSFVSVIQNTLKNNFEKYELIFIDDMSTDDSQNEIKKNVGKNSSVVSFGHFQGVENAMRAGVDISIGDFVFEFDSISSICTELMLADEIDLLSNRIMNLYYKSIEGFDIVSVCPKKSTNKFSSFFYKIFNKYSNYQYELHTDLFRILSRRAINRVYDMHSSIPYRKAIYANCGLQCEIILVDNIIKNYKKNKDEDSYKKFIAIDSLIIFTDVGFRISLYLTTIMVTLSIITLIYTVCIFLLQKPIAGWTTTMLYLSFAFSGMFLLLGIIIKYLSIIVRLVFKKRDYLIKSLEKITVYESTNKDK